jgi:hypothetical protein
MKILKTVALFLAASAVVALVANAQEASLNTPLARPAEAKYVLSNTYINFAANTAVIAFDVKDAGGTITIRSFSVNVPASAQPSATFANFLVAIGTARVGEVGGAERRANFRIIGYLLDNGYIAGVTLVP